MLENFWYFWWVERETGDTFLCQVLLSNISKRTSVSKLLKFCTFIGLENIFYSKEPKSSNRHLNSLGPKEGEDYSIIYLNNGDSKDDKILRTFAVAQILRTFLYSGHLICGWFSHNKQFSACLDTSWLSYKLIQTWHYLLGDCIRSHRLRVHSHKTMGSTHIHTS